MPSYDQPSGSPHSPWRIASWSSSRSARSSIGGNARPELSVLELVPAGADTDLDRPPLISSTVVTTLAKTPGWRNVTGETSTPRPIRSVSRARPARTVQASVVGWPAAPGKLAKWSDRKNASKPLASARFADGQLVGVAHPLLGLESSGHETHRRLLHGGVNHSA